VHRPLDGVPVLSCITLAHIVGDREITTSRACATTR
jgi:aerobic-type carbon monoxide dehydrogenase small subunit (CoxS/CutS family)